MTGMLFFAGCENTPGKPVTEPSEEAAGDEDNMELPRVFYSAPDGTIVSVALADGLDLGSSDIDKGNITGNTFFSGTYMDNDITVGYVEKEDAGILESIESIYTDTDESIDEIVGTKVRSDISGRTSQLFIKVPEEEDEKVFLPISLAYRDTAEGYIYVVMVDKRISDKRFDISVLEDILSSDYSGHYREPLDFLNNYIKVSNI